MSLLRLVSLYFLIPLFHLLKQDSYVLYQLTLGGVISFCSYSRINNFIYCCICAFLFSTYDSLCNMWQCFYHSYSEGNISYYVSTISKRLLPTNRGIYLCLYLVLYLIGNTRSLNRVSLDYY